MAIDFYAAGILSVPAGFKRISGPGATAGYDKERAVGRDEYGDDQASTVHSSVFRFEEVFESISDTMTIPPDLGVKDGAATILSLRAETGLQYLRLTIGAVMFTDADTAPTRKYTHGITLAQAFGAVDFMGATAGAAAHAVSGSITISCEVAGGFSGQGVYVQHEVHSGKIEYATSWMGKPSTYAGAGIDVVSAKPDRQSTDFLKWDVSGAKKLNSVSA